MNNLLFPLTSRSPSASAAASKGARPRGTGSCISVSDSLSLSWFISGQNQVITAIYLVSVWFDFVLPYGAWCSPEQLWCRPPEEERSETRLWLEFLNLVIDRMMNKIYVCLVSILRIFVRVADLRTSPSSPSLPGRSCASSPWSSPASAESQTSAPRQRSAGNRNMRHRVGDQMSSILKFS